MKKFTRIFLSKEEKRQLTEGNAWDSVISEIQKTFNLPPLLLTEKDVSSDLDKKQWVLNQLCIRQEWKCFWCGQTMTYSNPRAASYRTLEHVVPKASKGRNVHKLTNLRAACQGCNQGRSTWSTNKSLSVIVDNQRKRIKELETEHQEIREVLSQQNPWHRLRVWVKKTLRKESE